MKRSLNLMTHNALRRRTVNEAVWLWLRVLAVCVVLAGLTGALEAWRCEEVRQQKVALTAQHQPVQQLRNDLRVLRERINATNKRDRLALGIESSPPVLSVLSAVTEAASVFRGEAYVGELAYEPGSPTAPDRQPRTLLIGGVARDPAAIQRFVASLRGSNHFRDVRLGPTKAQLLRGTATTAFEVECVL